MSLRFILILSYLRNLKKVCKKKSGESREDEITASTRNIPYTKHTMPLRQLTVSVMQAA